MATTSSFFCSSPWTFCAPADPSEPVSPARESALAMRFPATPKRMRMSDSSPVAPGETCCASRMNRSRVIGARLIPTLRAGYFVGWRVTFHLPTFGAFWPEGVVEKVPSIVSPVSLPTNVVSTWQLHVGSM